jgi:hypothetical protein
MDFMDPIGAGFRLCAHNKSLYSPSKRQFWLGVDGGILLDWAAADPI